MTFKVVTITPFQGHLVIGRLGLATINRRTKCEVYMFADYEDIKGNAKCRNWVVSGVRDHQKSPAMLPLDRVHIRLPIRCNRNYASILHSSSDTT